MTLRLPNIQYNTEALYEEYTFHQSKAKNDAKNNARNASKK